MSQPFRPGRGRLWWLAFTVCVAGPAVILALLGLRVERIDELERARQVEVERLRVIRLADTLLTDALAKAESALSLAAESSEGARHWILLRLEPSGRVVLPRERILLIEPASAAADPSWNPRTIALVERARAAEARRNPEEAARLYADIGRIEPALRGWAELARAHALVLAGHPKLPELFANARGKPEEGSSPGGVPLPILAASYVEDVAPGQRPQFITLIRAALDGLRGGRCWLPLERRAFYDEELRRLLAIAEGGTARTEDARLREWGALAAAAKRSLSLLAAGVRRHYAGGGVAPVLVLWAGTRAGDGSLPGAAIPEPQLSALLDSVMRPLTAGNHFQATVNSDDGHPVWNPSPSGAVMGPASRLAAVPGWSLTFRETPESDRARNRRLLWYGFVGLLLVMLGGGLAGTIGVVRQEIQLSRLQSEFVGSVTHEFKSPIASIHLLVERLRGGRLRTPEGAEEYYGAIARETDRLDRLVSRILEFQKIQAGQRRYRFTPGSVAELAEAAVGRIRPQAQAKEIEIRLEIESLPPEIPIDGPAISDALDNLIDNAIKYSPPGSRIDVVVGEQGDRATVEVRDQGIGIDPADLARVFDRFYRGRRAEQHGVQGTGLGLSIAQAAVEAHGGSIVAESAPAGGTRFRLSLPVRREGNGQSADHR